MSANDISIKEAIQKYGKCYTFINQTKPLDFAI